MNNQQFRRLVLDKPGNGQPNGTSSTTTANNGSSTSFGGKKSSFMPMTPRSIKSNSSSNADFARQVRERHAAFNSNPAKAFKSSAPKGVKYGAGYTDRAKARAEAEESNGDGSEKAERIKALEEQMKLGQIPLETFEALRDEITGGDIESTHLVKGLDRKLLERVRRGEDVLGSGGNTGQDVPDLDDALDELGEKEVEAVKKKKVEKKGTMAPPSVAGVKRSRDDIMAELKAQRKAAAEARASAQLDNRWRKVGQREQSRIEIDHKGREVLIIVDEDGIVHKKVRKATASDLSNEPPAAEMPDPSKPVLGADTVIPEQPEKLMDEDDDDDIFEGVGTEYNPLGEADEEEEDESSDEDATEGTHKVPNIQRKVDSEATPAHSEAAISPSPDATKANPSSRPRNYFNDSTTSEEKQETDRLVGVQDLLKKAARMDPQRLADGDVEGDNVDEEKVRLQKRAAMLAQQDRDLDDMDMGFGGSRFEDGEEDGNEKVRLSEWKGTTAGEDGREEEEKKQDKSGKRKRKPKKRKGDVNNAADIMRIIDGRNKAGASK